MEVENEEGLVLFLSLDSREATSVYLEEDVLPLRFLDGFGWEVFGLKGLVVISLKDSLLDLSLELEMCSR